MFLWQAYLLICVAYILLPLVTIWPYWLGSLLGLDALKAAATALDHLLGYRHWIGAVIRCAYIPLLLILAGLEGQQKRELKALGPTGAQPKGLPPVVGASSALDRFLTGLSVVGGLSAIAALVLYLSGTLRAERFLDVSPGLQAFALIGSSILLPFLRFAWSHRARYLRSLQHRLEATLIANKAAKPHEAKEP